MGDVAMTEVKQQFIPDEEDKLESGGEGKRLSAYQSVMHTSMGPGSEGLCGCLFRYVFYFLGFLIALIPLSWFFCIKICGQNERFVRFRLGRVNPIPQGPGLFFLIPCVDSIERVDMRVRTIDMPSQEMLTKDSVTCHIDCIVYFRVVHAVKATVGVENFLQATTYLAQTRLRSVIGESELDEVLQKREAINVKLKKAIDQYSEEWGVEVFSVEVKDVVLPSTMQRAMATQAEAERARRAKVIEASGELQSSASLLAAADTISRNPTTIQLRYLQTLGQIATEKNSTIVFPVPVDLFSILSKISNRLSSDAPSNTPTTYITPSSSSSSSSSNSLSMAPSSSSSSSSFSTILPIA
eukprot:TRINITY_DN712_c4_g1_i1.p1 TRINITY_DN712_c4_g1~~TRINITY_DN712_c4_g1_i1.p1  ORF type:complete len:354 (-),score=89.54 TRINITY_DN712_c4_g1_i1:279-1340(-)